MKNFKNSMILPIMIGACLIESSGIWFKIAMGLIIVPSIVFFAMYLCEGENVIEYSEEMLLDMSTRDDMGEWA